MKSFRITYCLMVSAALLALSPDIFAQDQAQRIKKNVRTVQPIDESAVFGVDHFGNFKDGQTRTLTNDIPNDTLEYSVSWTSMSWHRVGNEPLEAILEGWINTTCATYWQLSDSKENPDLFFGLHFVEDVYGNNLPNIETVPVTWEYSLDNGLWSTLEETNGHLLIPIPPGYHTFQIRLTSTLPYAPQHGHYNLTLHQLMTPQL